MRYLKPCYYDTFRCSAQNCPDTCCAGWRIGIDETSLGRYAEEKGEFGRRLGNGIDWLEEAFLQTEGRCSLLNGEGLCDICLELGEEAMCEACRQYPRHTEEFDGVREYSLSLSCPEAARLILENPTPFCFFEKEDGKGEELAGEFEDFDSPLFEALIRARNAVYGVIGRREASFCARERAVLDMGQRLQAAYDESGTEGLERAAETPSGERPGESFSDRYRRMKPGLRKLKRLELQREEWLSVLRDAEELYKGGERVYEALCEEFAFFIGENRQERERWELFGQNLLVFFVYTYFCGAAYDGCIWGKTALAVFSAGCVRELVFARWLANGKRLGRGEWYEIAYRYAREVEHCDGNLNALEEWLSE